jgi:hypothetical protein
LPCCSPGSPKTIFEGVDVNLLLQQLAGRRICVLAKILARADGKTDKVPCALDGANSNAQDPQTWLLPDEAEAYAQALHLHVGVVITEGTKLACIDIDNALMPDNTTWSALAIEVCQRFPGAYVEISASGRGLHIFLTYTGEVPAHRTKVPGLECYTRSRFILTTGTAAIGDARTDHTAALGKFLADYFPAAPQSAQDASEWRTEPVAEWDGPREDDALIAIARRSRSAGAAFGNSASFEDLWTANAARLAQAFPSTSGDTWDHSSADLALANHLAFYTGGCHERVLGLMQQSGLVRDKWAREEWLRETITKACAQVKAVYKSKAPAATAPAAPIAGEYRLMTTNRRGQHEAVLENLVYVLQEQPTRIGYDQFRGRVMVAPQGTEDWQPLTDAQMIDMRETLARVSNFAPVGKDLMRDALLLVASRCSFDSAITWLNGLTWDGVPRVERFLAAYCGAVDDDYARAVSLYIWTGLAGRVLEPGCQLDMVVALKSAQGKFKSTGLQAMVPTDECFTDGLSLQDDDDNFKRLIRGKLIGEIAELAGLSRADINVVKRVVTRKTEVWIEKFQTEETRYPRRCMLFATTNEERFLPTDETGQRRWLPEEISTLDRARIAADRNQLWAEGAVLWRQEKQRTGTTGVLYAEAERLAAGRHKKFEQTDVWESAIEKWLHTPETPLAGVPRPPPCVWPLTIAEVLEGALGINKAHMDAKGEKRAARVLRQLGYESLPITIDGKKVRRWIPASAQAGP